jgi:hypothetical protein
MADIRIDPSTPAFSAAIGGANLSAQFGSGPHTQVSAAFSPPAGSLVVVLAAVTYGMYGESFATTGLTAQDSDGNSYAARISAPAGSYPAAPHTTVSAQAIFTRYYASPPGTITVRVTVDASHAGGIAAPQVALDSTPLVLTGAAADQSTAAAARYYPAAGSAQQVQFSPTAARSWVLLQASNYGVYPFTPRAGTTSLAAVQGDGTGDGYAVAMQAAPTVTPGPVTLGWSNQDSWVTVTALEILPGETSYDPGSPPWDPAIPGHNMSAMATAGPVTVRSATFAPPAGSLVAVMAAASYFPTEAGNPYAVTGLTCADSAGAQYQLKASLPAEAGPGNATDGTRGLAIFEHYYPAEPGSITADVTLAAAQVKPDPPGTCLDVMAVVINGAAPDQSLAATAGQVIDGTPELTVTTGSPGSWVLFVSEDLSASGVLNGSTAIIQAADDALAAYVQSRIAFCQAATPGPAGPVTLGWSGVITSGQPQLALEVIAAGQVPGGAAPAPAQASAAAPAAATTGATPPPVNDFESGTGGAQVSAAGSGSVRCAPFDQVTTSAGATLSYDSTYAAHGLLSAKIILAGTAGTAAAGYTSHLAGARRAWFRLYLRFPDPTPATPVWLAELRQASGTACAGLKLETNGRLSVYDTTLAGTPLLTMDQPCPAGAWFRVEADVTGSASAGAVTLTRYDNPDSATPTETKQGQASGGPPPGQWWYTASGPPGQYSTLLPYNAAGLPLSEAAAAARVSPVTERIAANATANNTPGPQDTASIPWGPATTGKGVMWTNYLARATGWFVGTTDEIFSWGCFRWGLDEDLVHAEAVRESSWRQATQGDAGLSQSILQIRAARSGSSGPGVNNSWGGYPWTHDSTPLAVDYFCAWFRAALDGHWPGFPSTSGYALMDFYWGVVGSWYSGQFQTSSQYVTNVKNALSGRTWTGYGSISPRSAPGGGGSGFINTGGPVSQAWFGATRPAGTSQTWNMDDPGVSADGPLGPVISGAATAGQARAAAAAPAPTVTIPSPARQALAGPAPATAAAAGPSVSIATLSEDPSTPVTAGTGTGTSPSASQTFTPPAGMWIIALVTLGHATGTPTVTLTNTGAALTWQPGPQNNNGSAFAGTWKAWTGATPPGPVTVTARDTVAQNGSIQLACHVLAGALADQAAAGSGSVTGTSSAPQGPVTTHTPGSRVYFCAQINALQSSVTPIAGSTGLTDYQGSGQSDGLTGRSAQPTGTPGATTFGWTAATSAGWAWAGVEVLPSVVTRVYAGQAPATAAAPFSTGLSASLDLIADAPVTATATAPAPAVSDIPVAAGAAAPALAAADAPPPAPAAVTRPAAAPAPAAAAVPDATVSFNTRAPAPPVQATATAPAPAGQGVIRVGASAGVARPAAGRGTSQVYVAAPGSARWTMLGQYGHVTDLTYSFVMPGGADKLSCTLQLPAASRAQPLTPGWQVRVTRGAHQVWAGRLDEPSPGPQGWQITAVGLGQRAADFSAVYTGWPAGQPDDAINEAVARGLGWQNPGVGRPAWAWFGTQPDPAAQTLKQFLDNICFKGAGVWYVNSQPGGVPGSSVALMPIPSAVNRLLVVTTPVPRTLGADVTRLWIRYQASADNTSTANGQAAAYALTSVLNQPGQDAHGATEAFLDLSSAGVMTATAAQATGGQILSVYQRISYAGPFTAAPGQLLTVGGVPVDLGTEQAGTVIRAIISDFGFGGEASPAAPVTFPVGGYSYDDEHQIATITPFQSLTQSLSGLLQLQQQILQPPTTTTST